jgi:poly-gamma-glutamate capsule biosynthesis protein CapA/YwtB (metallophosphatase superfamily)
MNKSTSFLLILASAFLIILVYVMSRLVNFGPADILGITNQTKIVFVGDIMLGRSVMAESLKANDFSYAFKNVNGYLQSADLVFGNLESPFAVKCPTVNSGMTFCADTRLVEGLTKSDINVVTLANNHMNNYGNEGVVTTKKVLTDNGIGYTGDGNLVTKEVNGTTFGFLGLNLMYGAPTKLDEKILSDSDKLVDVLIVGVHWGEEYQSKANKRQRDYAKKLVELGADIVIGHHPHWVQDSEVINGKPVYYSLGNFVFDQMWSEETKKGLVVELTFDGSNLVNQKELPIYIKKIGQPEFVSKVN